MPSSMIPHLASCERVRRIVFEETSIFFLKNGIHHSVCNSTPDGISSTPSYRCLELFEGGVRSRETVEALSTLAWGRMPQERLRLQSRLREHHVSILAAEPMPQLRRLPLLARFTCARRGPAGGRSRRRRGERRRRWASLDDDPSCRGPCLARATCCRGSEMSGAGQHRERWLRWAIHDCGCVYEFELLRWVYAIHDRLQAP